MEWIKKNWLIIALIIVACLTIYLILKPNPDRLLLKEMERERNEARKDYNDAQKKIEGLQQDTAILYKRFQQYLKRDSIQNRQEEIEYEKLKDAYYKIQYGHLNDADIDSVWNDLLKRAGYKK